MPDSKKSSPSSSKTAVANKTESKSTILEVVKSTESKKSGKKMSASIVASLPTSQLSIRAVPRPGGYIKIIVPPNNVDFKNKESNNEFILHPCTCMSSICQEIGGANSKQGMGGKDISFGVSSHDTTREFRINKTVNEMDWDGTSMRDGDFEDDSDVAQEAVVPQVNLVAVLFSFIMMSASDHKVSDSEVRAVVSYLDCIRDEENNTPPNVQGLLNYIELTYGIKGKPANKRPLTAQNSRNKNITVTSTIRVKPQPRVSKDQ